jgi:hypothetical protein
MNKCFLFFLILFCAFLQGQNQYIIEKNYKHQEFSYNVKDVTFKQGKPVFIVMYISQQIPPDSLVAVRELKELKKNYSNLNANFYYVWQNGKLNFEDSAQTTIDVTEYNDSFEKVIYWSGKVKDNVYERNGDIVESTEYFDEIINKRESSYIDAYYKKVDSIKDFYNGLEKDLVAAKKSSDALLKNMILEELFHLKKWSNYLPFNFKGIKKITINSNMPGYSNPYHDLFFNEKALLVKGIIQSDDSDKKKVDIVFAYQNEMLSNYYFQYKDTKYNTFQKKQFDFEYFGKYIVNKKIEDVYNYSQDGFLLKNSYNFSERNYFLSETIDTYKNNVYTYHNFNNEKLEVINEGNQWYLKHTEKQDKLVKDSDTVYAIYDQGKRSVEINYNQDNTIKTVKILKNTFNKKRDYDIQFDYTYERY